MPTSNLIVPAAGLLLAVVLRASNKKKRKPSAAPAKQCPPYRAVDAAEVLATARKGIEQGLESVKEVTAYVAGVLYPLDVNGVTIPWPKHKPFVLPPDFAAATVCLYAEIKDIVKDLPLTDEPEDPHKPGEVLTDLLAKGPTFGRFYLLQNYVKGVGMQKQVALGSAGLIAQALNRIVPGAGTKNTARMAVLKMMSTPNTWNVNLYGRTKFTENWPGWTGVDGRNIGTAWLPRHKNAIETIAQGQMPKRNINAQGTKAGIGGSYGLLWFPPIDAEQLANLGVITDAGMAWNDESTTRNPPPELLKLLA